MNRLALLAAACALLACSSRKDASAPSNTMPDVAYHSAHDFPVSPGDVHGAAAGQPLTTCNWCHGDRSGGAPSGVPPGVPPYPPSASFKTFTCTGCHVQVQPGVLHDDVAGLATLPGHAGHQADFDPAQPLAFDQKCFGCHRNGWGVDHALVFPVPHQDSTGTVIATCSDCHTSQTDRTVLGCAACHPHDQPATAAAHASVPGFDATGTAAASALCAKCHGDSTIPIQVSAHTSPTAFPIGAGTTHSGPAGTACLSCHDVPRTAPKTFAADFSQADCVGCHAVVTAGGLHDNSDGALATFHANAGVTGFLATTSACLQCHPDGAGGAPSYHPLLFPIDAASKHAGISCASCHGTGTSRADVTQLLCAQCHGALPGFATQHDPLTDAQNGGTIAILVQIPPPPLTSCAPVPLPPLTSPDCLMCHALSHVDHVELAPASGGHPVTDTTFGHDQHEGAGCFTCHVATTQVLPTGAASGYTAIDFTQPSPASQSSTGCAKCHANGCGGGGGL